MNLKKLQQQRRKQLRMVCDSVPHLPMFRADVSAGVFARHLVTATLNELFRHEFEETKWANGLLVPIDGSLSDGANEYSYNEIAHSGRAEIVADDATDVPRAEIQGSNNVLPVKTVACSFRYSTQEVRSAQMSGMFNLPTEKSLAAREAHDFALNNFIRDGVPTHGLHGFTTAPGLIVQTATTGTWSTATAAQIVTDFTDAVNAVINSSGGVEVPDSAVFPITQWTRISTLQNSTASDVSVLTYLKQAFPHITSWDWEPGLATAAAAGGPAAMIYKKDPRKARVVQPMTLNALAPEQKGLTFTVTLESRFGGVMAPKPRSMMRLEGI